MSFFNYPTYNIPDTNEEQTKTLDKDLVIIVKEEDFGEAQVALASKIIGAAGQDMKDAQILKMKEASQIKISNWGEKGRLVLVFDNLPSNLGLQVSKQLYHSILIDQTTLIFSQSLADLPQHVEARRALWRELKRFYNL